MPDGLSGYSLPRSPEGRASLVPPPPWHYVGDFLVIEYWADPDAVAGVLPPGLEPYADDPGRAAALFVDWQSCTSGQAELLDPARSQYKEFFIVVNATLDGELITSCPYIWVDQDFALVRGWIQGFPKKLGSIQMTRTFGLDCLADPGIKPGAAYGGTVAANDRRLAQQIGQIVGKGPGETGIDHALFHAHALGQGQRDALFPGKAQQPAMRRIERAEQSLHVAFAGRAVDGDVFAKNVIVADG